MMKMNRVLLLLGCLMLCILLTGCNSTEQSVADLTCAQIAEKAQNAVAFSELTDVNVNYLEKYLMIDAVDLEDWVMRRDASRATPEMILVLKVKADADQAAIKQAIQEYHDEQIMAYRDYQPAQMPKLEGAKVMENGQFIVLIVSPDAAKVNTALGSGWK